jgi:hypothetical protein
VRGLPDDAVRSQWILVHHMQTNWWRRFKQWLGMEGKTRSKTIRITVGANEASVTVSDGVATVVTDYVQTLTDRMFFRAIIEAARSQGATSLVVQTGAVHDINLAIKLGEAAQTGRTIVGGRVTTTSHPEVTEPSFELRWDTLPDVTP